MRLGAPRWLLPTVEARDSTSTPAAGTTRSRPDYAAAAEGVREPVQLAGNLPRKVVQEHVPGDEDALHVLFLRHPPRPVDGPDEAAGHAGATVRKVVTQHRPPSQPQLLHFA